MHISSSLTFSLIHILHYKLHCIFINCTFIVLFVFVSKKEVDWNNCSSTVIELEVPHSHTRGGSSRQLDSCIAVASLLQKQIPLFSILQQRKILNFRDFSPLNGDFIWCPSVRLFLFVGIRNLSPPLLMRILLQTPLILLQHFILSLSISFCCCVQISSLLIA